MRCRFTGLLPRSLLLRLAAWGGARGMPGRRRGRRPARASPCKGLRPTGRLEDGGGPLRTETPPSAFSDLRLPGSATLLVLRGLELEVSHRDAADQAVAVPAHIHTSPPPGPTR